MTSVRNLKRQSSELSELSDSVGPYGPASNAFKRFKPRETRGVKRQSSDLSDSWGPEWQSNTRIKAAKEEPTDSDVELEHEGQNSQPRDWQNWDSGRWEDASVQDGGTGSSDWANADESWTSDSWNGREARKNDWWWDDAWSQKEPDTAKEVWRVESELETELADLDAGDPEDGVMHDGLELDSMGARDKKKYTGHVDALQLLEDNKLPSSHKSLQDMRRVVKGNPEKYAGENSNNKDFQRRFLEGALEEVAKKYIFTESIEETEYIKGNLESFDAIVAKEGGAQNPANIEAARQRCKTCMRKGRRYYKRCKWSKRVRYMYVEEGFENKAIKNWAMRTTGSGDQASIQAAPKEEVPKAAPKPEPKKKAAKQPTQFEITMSKGTAMKKAYLDAEVKGNQMLENMTTLREYAKEKASYEAELRDLLTAMKDAQKAHAFNGDFLLKDISDVKQMYEASDLYKQLDTFNEALKLPVQGVEKKVEEILAVVRARLLMTKGSAAAVTKKDKKKTGGHT